MNTAVDFVPNSTDANAARRNAMRQRLNEMLLAACNEQDVSKLVAALWAGADLNARDQQGMTALHRCAARGHAEGVKILMARGSDPMARCHLGWTADQWADKGGHQEVVALLARQHTRSASSHADRIAPQAAARALQDQAARLQRGAQQALRMVQKATITERALHCGGLRAA